MIESLEKVFAIENNFLSKEAMENAIEHIIDFGEIRSKFKEDTFFIDYVPGRITDVETYEKLEIYYDGIEGDVVKAKKYHHLEEKLVKMILKLNKIEKNYIYSSIIHNHDHLPDELFSKIGVLLKEILDALPKEDQLTHIEDEKILEAILKLSFREKTDALLIFPQKKSILWIDATTIPVFSQSEEFISTITNEVANNNLYIWT